MRHPLTLTRRFVIHKLRNAFCYFKTWVFAMRRSAKISMEVYLRRGTLTDDNSLFEAHRRRVRVCEGKALRRRITYRPMRSRGYRVTTFIPSTIYHPAGMPLEDAISGMMYGVTRGTSATWYSAWKPEFCGRTGDRPALTG